MQQSIQELVVLVDENNQVLGTEPKSSVHTTKTPLHRAFSIFLFNSRDELLVTQRAKSKKTFAGVWTNTACGHVGPNETTKEAATRRLDQELGYKLDLREVAPYRYKFADQNGIVENEICPIFVGLSDVKPHPHAGEVDAWKWVPWVEFLVEIRTNPVPYSPWCREEAEIIATGKLRPKDLGLR